MRFLLTTILLTSLLTLNFASDTTLVFKPSNYTEAIEMAKAEKKPLFLYFHFDGCGACRKMEKTTFKEDSVYTFYNENFICFEINTLKGEGLETNKLYKVKMHPTFMFLDEDQNLLHKMVGIYSPEDFILEAKIALDPNKNLSYYKSQYEQGNREATFLFDYCYKLKNAYLLDSFMINEYLNSQSIEDFEKEENIRFIFEFAVHHFNLTMPVGSNAFNFLLNNQKLFAEHFDSEQVTVRILFIINHAIYEAIEQGNIEKFNKGLRLLDHFDTEKAYYFKEMDGRTTGYITGHHKEKSKMAFYKKNGKHTEYEEVLLRYIKKIWNDSDALNEMAWQFYEESHDLKFTEMAEKWVIRSIELDSNYANNDTYAALLFKLEKYSAALTQTEKAISIAKEKGADYRETSELLKKIKEKI